MMILAEPNITAEAIAHLGRQMALLFRQVNFSIVKFCNPPFQDEQLWEVKASQLNEWVERGLLNVKLLDRTLAYFQNQSSFLQYIKTFKRPVPRIESPGFPGTQWNEFYWKDQTVMLLMQEPDFPDGKNPEFCAQLFLEEPGKWKLKMEQFRRWLDRGKNDPLPEYYGTGKNCTECGVFLWDTKSYVKHMRRNHGFKVKDGKLVGISQDVLKRDRIEEQRELERRGLGERISSKVEASPEQDPFDALIQSSSRGPASSSALKTDDHLHKYLLSDDSDLDEDTEDSTNDVRDIRRGKNVKESKSQPVSKPTKTMNMPADTKASKKTYDMVETPARVDSGLEKTGQDREDDSAGKVEPSSSSDPPAKRASSARNRQPDEDTIVSCPECGHQCPHSKIINHLKKCTRKMAPSKRKAPKSKPKVAETEQLEKILDENPPEPEVPEVIEPSKPEPKKPKESKTAAIVKQIFMRKFAMQQEDSGLSEEDDIPRVAEKVISPPPIKIKLQRKDLSRESFEVSGDGSLNISKTDDSFDRLEPLVKEKLDTKEVYDFDSNLTMEETRPKYRKANTKPSYQEDWDSSDFSLSSFRDATEKEDRLREEKIREEKAREAKLKAEIEKLKAVKLQEIMRKEDMLKERLKAEKLKEIMLQEEKMREEKEKQRLCLEKEKAEEANRKEEQKRIKDQERREEEKRRREEVKRRREEERKIREEEARAEADKKKEEERLREKEKMLQKEEDKRKKEERRKAEEERKKAEEERRKAKEEEERLMIEKKQKQEEEEKRRDGIRLEEEKRKEEEKKQEEERQAEEEKSREEDDKSEDEFSLLALTKPHKRFQYSDYRSGKYQEKEQKKEDEKKRKEDEERKKAEEESKRRESQDKTNTEDSFAKLEPLIHPSPSLVTEPRTPMLTKAAKKDIPSMIADDFAQEIFQACIDDI